MRVRAKYNVTYNGEWKRGGEMFEISTTDDFMLPHVDVMETPVREAKQDASAESADGAEPVKRRAGRPRKTDTENQ